LASDLVHPGGLWTSIEVVDSIGSSNTLLAERAGTGSIGHGAVLVAEEQTAGRGRRERGWVAPKYSSVMASILIEPAHEPAAWGWIPLVTALAVTDAVSGCGVQSTIKWPNDVVVGESKLAGVLCEVVPTPRGHAVVAGWGLNVDQEPTELPTADATSMRMCGGSLDRAALLVECLHAWERWYRVRANTELSDRAVIEAYVERSSTLGKAVRVHLPDGAEVSGIARRLDANGHLVVDVDGVERVIAAADVVHLRRAGLRP
jgi:BirA family biotin operon repressor/biotin-[acetyl-CoA-carboxylase] ligase